MRISDWSSDVCSSDLPIGLAHLRIGTQNLVVQQAGARVLATADEPGGNGAPGECCEHRPAEPDDVTEDRYGADFRRLAISGQLPDGVGDRSEEHTSELQSLMRISYAVFCLKKKTK